MIGLREVNIDDLMLIYEWANDPLVRAQSFNSEPIPIEKHTEWFKKILKNNNVLFFIMTEDNQDIGQIRLALESEKALISYMIAPNKRGKGYGKKIIELAENMLKEKKTNVIYLEAEVKLDNEASMKVFEKCGFEKVSEKEYATFIKRI